MKKFFNGKAKNFLAALLCLCMVAAMIPAMPAAQAADSVTVSFTSANTALKTYTYGMQGGAGAGSFAAYTLTAGKWMAFTLGELPAGEYNADFKYTASTAGAKADIYVVPCGGMDLEGNSYNEVSNAMRNNAPIGNVSFYTAGNSTAGNSFKFNFNAAETGEYLLIAKVTELSPTPLQSGNYAFNYIYPESLTLTVPDKYVSSMDISFAQGDFEPTTTRNGYTGEGDCYGYQINAFGNASRDYIETLFVASNVNSVWMAFDLGYITKAKLNAGTYSLTLGYVAFASAPVADIYLVEMDDVMDNWYNDLKSIPANNEALGRVTMTGNSEKKSVTFKNIELDGGNYVLFIKPVEAAEGNLNYVGFNGVSLEPYTAPVIEPGIEGNVEEENPIFGNAYAYIHDNADGTVAVSFVGGVDGLEGYAKVGYEISVNGGASADADSDMVYTSLTVNDETYGAESYGGGYIFIGSQDGISEGSVVTAKPYVKDADGNKIYHGDVVLTLKV